VSVVDPAGMREEARHLLPPLLVETRTPAGAPDSLGRRAVEVRRVAAAPYAGGVAAGCAEAVAGGCEAGPVVFATSAAVPLEGAAAGGVLRVAGPGQAGRDLPAPVVLPGFVPLGADTVASAVAVLGAGGGGRDTLRWAGEGRSGCLALHGGAGIVAAAPVAGGPVFVAAGDGEGRCGPGTGLIRVDRPAGPDPVFSAGARRNQLGDLRLPAPLAFVASRDGSRLLLLGGGRVFLLDAMLRVIGSVPADGAHSVTWEAGAGGGPGRFAVAGGDEVRIYSPAQLRAEAAVVLGPIRPGTLGFGAAGGSAVLVAVEPGGTSVVAARVDLGPEGRPE
jgi:hypothetical protein